VAGEAVITNLTEERVDVFIGLVGEYLAEKSEIEPDFTPAPDWQGSARDFYLAEMKRNDLFIRLITWEDKPFGFAISSVTDAPFFKTRRIGYISNVFVIKEVRSFGFGTALIEDALKILENNGAVTVQLNALVLNEKTKKFWERFGFKDYMVRMKRGRD